MMKDQPASIHNSACVMLIPDSTVVLDSYPHGVSEWHCTLFYLGSEDDVDNYFEVSSIVGGVSEEILSKNNPVTAKVVDIITFPKGEDGIPVVFKLESPELIELNRKIVSTLKDMGIESSSKFKDYKPHITLGYTENLDDVPDFKGPFYVTFNYVNYSVSGKDNEVIMGSEQEDIKALVDTDPDPSPNAGATRLREYWIHGRGAAKIRWGSKGDWTRCVRQLEKYVGPRAKGLCQVYHKEANGYYTGDRRNKSFDLDSEFDLEQTEALLYAETLKQLDISDILDLLGDKETKGNDMDLQYKTVGVSGGMKETDEDGVIEAFVSVTGIEDNVKDIIEPGAYTKTLSIRKPKGAWSHEWSTPVSKALVIEEYMPGDERLPKTLANGDPWPDEAGGLYVKTQFNLNTQRGREAYEDVKFFGSDAEWSIGYKVSPGNATVDRETGIRHIKALDLFEFSPVLFGAASNARSLVTSVKSLFDDDEDFYKVIDEIKSEDGKPEDKVVTEPVIEEVITKSAEIPFTGTVVEKLSNLQSSIGALLDELVSPASKSHQEPEEKSIALDESVSINTWIDESNLEDNKKNEIKSAIVNLEDNFAKQDSDELHKSANSVLDLISTTLDSGEFDQKTIDNLKNVATSIGVIAEKHDSIMGVEVIPPIEEVKVEPVIESKVAVDINEWKNLNILL